MRSLSPEEAELWAKVTATIQPLSRERVQRRDPEPAEEKRPQTRRVAKAPKPAAIRRPAPPTGPGTTLDSSWDRKLLSGAVSPDRVVDLHGLDLDRAWHAIDRALEQSISSGERILLLITGHRREGEPPLRRGRIRAAVDDWLAASRHASRIAAVRAAHRRHGGGGSLYIILRRR